MCENSKRVNSLQSPLLMPPTDVIGNLSLMNCNYILDSCAKLKISYFVQITMHHTYFIHEEGKKHSIFRKVVFDNHTHNKCHQDFFRPMHNIFNHLLACLCVGDILFLLCNLALVPIAFGVENDFTKWIYPVAECG